MTEPASGIHAQIDNDRKTAQPDAAMVKTYRAYARGRQRGTLTAGQQRILRGLLAHRFCDNVCAMVLSALSNRLLLTRFEVVTENKQAGQGIETYLRLLWTLNSLPALSTATHFATLRDGNHAIGLSWQGNRTGRTVLTRERWWNGKDGMFVAYDDHERPTYAVKEWQEGGRSRRTIYYADRIERYLMDGNGWRLFNLPDDEVQGNRPVPWVTKAKQPIGIPVVHFAAQAVPNDGDDKKDDAPQYGMSMLDGGLLGLQDEINDVHRDITAGARFAGYQMLWATGVTPPKDPQGNDIPYRVEPGAFLTAAENDAAFGTFPPGSLAELERTLTIKLQAVGRKTGVPMHLIGGDWPSGEAIVRAERALIDAVEANARVIGPAWGSVMHKATVLANTFGAQAFDETLPISAVFAPAEARDPLTRASIATQEAPFVSERQTLRTLGYAPADVERIMAEKDAEKDKALQRQQAMMGATQPPQQGASNASQAK